MKILFTGAASFTGYWFVKELCSQGHEVICPLRGSSKGHTVVKQLRMETIRSLVELVEFSPFGSETFLDLAKMGGFGLLCHHAAEVREYRSPDFDVHAAVAGNTRNLKTILSLINCPVLLTGSIFEQDEGIGEYPLRAFSSYGLSKGLTYQYFRYYCEIASLPLGKFVIPNPFGAYEEPRFTAYLMNSWKAGRVAEVKTPDYIRDNIPVDLLASEYVRHSQKLAQTTNFSILTSHPSGYVGTQGDFVAKIACEVKKRTARDCEYFLAEQKEFSEPLKRVNSEKGLEKASGWNESKFWDDFVRFYN